MKKLGIGASIIVITSVFIYSMIYLSDKSICSGVRVFDCQIKENKSLVSEKKYIELKPKGDIFLKNCKPKISEEENNYLLDYSNCDLKISIGKENMLIEEVKANGESLSRELIDSKL